VTKDLASAWAADGVQKIMNLTIVPYGNAKKSGDKYTCQHGTKECEGNRWEQCAIAHNPDPVKHFPFYDCVEKSNGKPSFKVASSKCAKSAGLDFSAIETCFNGAESTSLQAKYAALTPADHKYTPWVEFNGKVMPQRGTFLGNLCKEWKKLGGKKPSGCPKIEEDAKEPCDANW